VSNEAITWAYQQPVSTGAKFVLVALADLADEAHSCYPGQAKLAAMTGQSDRSVRRQLLELEIAGYLTRARRFDNAGHRTSDRYVLPVGQTIPTGQSDQRTTRPPAKRATGQSDLRSITTSLPDNDDSPTGQVVQVSLREPTIEPLGSFSSAKAERGDVERICTHLADQIEANGSKRPRITQTWRTEARLLIDKDDRTETQIIAAINWCQADPFWRANILSMPTLREKYDQLRLAAARPTGTGVAVRPTGPSNDHIARAATRLGVAR
jgi:hypothetical protein